MKVYLIPLFIIYFSFPVVAYDTTPYCFRFTWLGSATEDDTFLKNCSLSKDIPCVYPVYYSATPPNLTDFWKGEKKSEVTCDLRPGHICVKYTYMYNNAVINITRFCGKMTENTKTAISSGCYSQQVDGHTVEACACISSGGRFPCNSSSQHKFTYMNLLICVVMTVGLRKILF